MWKKENVLNIYIFIYCIYDLAATPSNTTTAVTAEEQQRDKQLTVCSNYVFSIV